MSSKPIRYALVHLFALLLLAIAAASFAGCAGTKARQNVLIPTMQQAWAHMAPEAAAGGGSQADIAAFTKAIESNDIATIATTWPSLKVDVTKGIASEKVSPGIKASDLERLNQFDAGVQKLLAGSSQPVGG